MELLNVTPNVVRDTPFNGQITDESSLTTSTLDVSNENGSYTGVEVHDIS